MANGHLRLSPSLLQGSRQISIPFNQRPALGPRGPSIYSKPSFSFRGPHPSLSLSADRALHAPDWLLLGLTSIQTGAKASLLDLLDAVFSTAPISMNNLKEFLVCTKSPRHFLMLAVPYPIQRERDLRSARWRHVDVVVEQPGSRPCPHSTYSSSDPKRTAPHPYLGRTNVWALPRMDE